MRSNGDTPTRFPVFEFLENSVPAKHFYVMKFSSAQESERDVERGERVMRMETGKEGGVSRKTQKRHEQNDPSRKRRQEEKKKRKRVKNHHMPCQPKWYYLSKTQKAKILKRRN